MATRTGARRVPAVLFVLLVLGGVGVGAWNQQISACHERYDDDTTVVVTCEDSFTDVVTALSVLGVAVGGVGFVAPLPPSPLSGSCDRSAFSGLTFHGRFAGEFAALPGLARDGTGSDPGTGRAVSQRPL